MYWGKLFVILCLVIQLNQPFEFKETHTHNVLSLSLPLQHGSQIGIYFTSTSTAELLLIRFVAGKCVDVASKIVMSLLQNTGFGVGCNARRASSGQFGVESCKE